jgi:hypothetical protein
MGGDSDEEAEEKEPATGGREEEAEYDFMWMSKRPCALIIFPDGLLHTVRSPSLAWGNSEIKAPSLPIWSTLLFDLIDCPT